MLKIQEQKDYDALKIKIQTLPLFVNDYIHFKLGEKLSPSSLLEYSRDVNMFFLWLKCELIPNIKRIDEIGVHHLEELTVENIREFEEYLRVVENMMERTISRKIHSIRSLFNYLHDVAENAKGEPLIRRNVFRKISMSRVSSPISNARAIQDKVLHSDAADDFVSYIRTRYRSENATNLQALWNYDLNGIRDTCIVSLMLKSGLLVSDIVNLNLADISMHNKQITISRQWSGQRSSHIVLFSDSTKDDLQKYFNVRALIYQPENDETAFFLAVPNGHKIGKRMTKRAVQEMVNKYSAKYGKPEVTTRQLRHSFGLEHQKYSSMVQTKQQLALRSIESTEKYQILTELVE
ncbi:MAG: tyrosine recombinase XerS [Bacillota bacterium]